MKVVARTMALGTVVAMGLAVAWFAGSVSAHEPKTGQTGKASQAMHLAMKKGCDMATTMSGSADHDFASLMVMHHQAAVDMAKIEIADGSDAKMKEMARKMVAAQEKEIVELNAWMKAHPPAKAQTHEH